MRKYKDLFIDLDDTLYDFSGASREAFRETYELLGYDSFFDSFEQYMTIYEPYNLELWRIYGEGKITKEELNKRRYSHPLEVVGVNDPELAATFCREALSRIPTKNKLIPGAKELLEYLRPHYRLHILSNGFKELQAHKMSTTGILDYFDNLILSEDIGVNKPNRELYEHALERAEATVEKSLMIGDMFDTDIKGAANIGMDQLFFNPKNKECSFAPTYMVFDLLKIKDIL
ncbi:MAG: YjjG family noncanonical pyrimidine nucleotidase [Bacteroidaceae bacterium]|nr:YjjG family noncanonical pyrimidine nucleotidase [Bacteroidaceae bacterium]